MTKKELMDLNKKLLLENKRHCNKCGKTHPIENFYSKTQEDKNGNLKTTYINLCKDCEKERKKKVAKGPTTNRNKIQQRNQELLLENKRYCKDGYFCIKVLNGAKLLK